MNFIKYLKQPFPKLESKWRIIISISLFVAFFLMIFQPFGINYIDSNIKFLILSGYGLVTFVALFITTLGILSLSAFSAAQRRKEIGIRKVQIK